MGDEFYVHGEPGGAGEGSGLADTSGTKHMADSKN